MELNHILMAAGILCGLLLIHDSIRVFRLRGDNEYSEWSTPNDACSGTPGCTSPESPRLRANGTEERDLSAAINPEADKFYDITLDKNKGYTDDGQGNYTVTSTDGLMNVAELVNGGKTDINITLDKDINLTGIDWTPIETESQPDTGRVPAQKFSIQIRPPIPEGEFASTGHSRQNM